MVAAAILAGGKGKRLGGANKSFVSIEGRPVIDRQLAVLRQLFEEIVIVAPSAAPFAAHGIDLPVIPDRRGPGLGPLAGLDAALDWLPARYGSVVIVAGDLPFLARPVLERLRDTGPPGAPAVVPRVTGPAGALMQPLCARYHRDVADVVAAELDAGTRAMHLLLRRIDLAAHSVRWLDEPELRSLDPQLATFVNINTPADLALTASR